MLEKTYSDFYRRQHTAILNSINTKKRPAIVAFWEHNQKCIFGVLRLFFKIKKKHSHTFWTLSVPKHCHSEFLHGGIGQALGIPTEFYRILYMGHRPGALNSHRILQNSLHGGHRPSSMMIRLLQPCIPFQMKENLMSA